MIQKIIFWIIEDYRSYPLRFILEGYAWVMSISCSILLAITVKDPAFYALYPMWISGCLVAAWAAYTRKSFGFLFNYILLSTIDTVGFVRYLL